MIEQIKEWLSLGRAAAIIVGCVLAFGAGALGHCGAVAGFEPRLTKVEQSVDDLRRRSEDDRAILHRLDGMVSAIALHLGVRRAGDE